jgi:hypothetical protein
MGDNVMAWQIDYFEKNRPIAKCEERFVAAKLSFAKIWEHAVAMPNTKRIMATILNKVAEIEERG